MQLLKIIGHYQVDKILVTGQNCTTFTIAGDQMRKTRCHTVSLHAEWLKDEAKTVRINFELLLRSLSFLDGTQPW